MTTNVARDVAAAVGSRPMLIPAPYVSHRGRCSDDKTYVKACYDLCLRLDGRAAHFTHARAWAHVRMTDSGDAEMFFFLVMLLLCETESVGSIRCHADPDSESNTYKETVKLAALGTRASKPEQATLRALTKSDRMVNLRFNHDVHQERMRLQKKDAAAGGKERPTKKAMTKKDSAAAAPSSVPAAVPIDLSLYAEDFSIRIDTTTNVYDVDDVLAERASHIWEQALNKLRPRRSVNVDVAPEETALEEPFMYEPYSGPKDAVRKKITFTVTPLPVAGGDISNPNDIACMYVRFLVHDDAINPGVFFEELVENARRRRSQALAGGSTGGGRGRVGLPEMFPNYASLFETHHPTGNNVTVDTYFKHVLSLMPSIAQMATNDILMEHMNIRSPVNIFHLNNILTTQRACSVAMDAGCDPDLLLPGAWWSHNTGVARFPPAHAATTYVWVATAVFWKRESHLGLAEQYFPHIDMDSDFLATLVAGGKVDRFLGLADNERPAPESEEEGVAQMRGAFHRFRSMIQNNHMIERAALMSNTLVDYQTNNEFVHRAAEAKIINNRVAQFKPSHYEETFDRIQKLMDAYPNGRWRTHVEFDADLESKVQDCERYNELCNKAQAACTKSFMGLWQIEGDIDWLPVPDPIRALLKWYRDNQYTRFPHVSREFVMWDPALGIFGNSMLRQLKFYSCIGRVLQPIICLLAEGLFSCFRWSPGKLAFNMLLHGRYDTGKSFMAISILLRLTTIPGTVMTFCNSTPAADTTQNHKYDIIIASDEVMPWKVNEQEARKVPQLVNKEKVKLTDRKVGTHVFCKERGPNGEDIRWSRTITSDHYVSLVEVTNEPVDETGALSSRSFRMVVPASNVPAREMQGEMGASLDENARTYLQLNQFLSAGAYKLIQCGGMLEPDLQLFHDISNRVIDYLTEQNAISKDQGNRNLEIMTPYVIQCIIHNAIHCVFDMPSGVHYRKQFKAEMLYDLQPYMYATVEIVWWCWTALAGGWIEQNNRNVIRAAIKTAGVDDIWREGDSPYAMYERDTEDRIPWRRHDNPAGQNAPPGVHSTASAKLVDLQYITLKGTFENVCRNISSNTVPHLDYTTVKGILKVLAATMVALPGGGYKPQDEALFKHWHKYTQLPGNDGEPGVKAVDNDGSMVPSVYRFRDPSIEAANVMRCELDVPRIGPNAKNTVVDLSTARLCVHIMPHVADAFSNSKIIDALKFATLHRNMRAGKMLLGMPSDLDATQMRIFACPRHYITAIVRDMDQRAGWDDRGNWTGNPDVPVEERGMPRSKGICFNRRGGISKTDSIYFTYAPSVPVRAGDAVTWDIKARHDVESISALQLHSTDLDADSAKRRHIVCGRPLDEPVRTQQFILDEYKKAVAAAGERPDWHADVDYPHENIVENANRAAVWRNASDMGTAKQTFAEICDQDYDIPRKDMAAQVQERARKDLARSRGPDMPPPPPPPDVLRNMELPRMPPQRARVSGAHEAATKKRARDVLEEVNRDIEVE
jgi:hypothetical protein